MPTTDWHGLIVYLVGVAAAAALGSGLMLQQRVASRPGLSAPFSRDLLARLIRTPLWWLGVAAMACGQTLGGWALQLGSVSLIEALLSTYLLFALVAAAVLARRMVSRREVAGAALLSAALAVFITVGRPRASHGVAPHWPPVLLTLVAVAATVAALAAVARRRRATLEAVLVATAVGVVGGFQDASTRAALVVVHRFGIAGLFARSLWPYLVVAAGATSLLLAQSAYRAGRLNHSLPPSSVAEPLVGIAVGIALLGDRVAHSPVDLTAETLAVAAMICGAVLVARAPVFVHVGRAAGAAPTERG